MPDGIYLNARNLGISKLAKEINDIIYNRSRYYEFFKWHNYYSYHDTTKDDYSNTFCGLCALLNRKTVKSESTVNKYISGWWNITDHGTTPSNTSSAADTRDSETSATDGVTEEQQDDVVIRTLNTVPDNIQAFFTKIVNFFKGF